MDTEVRAFFHEMGSQQTARRVIGSPETDPGRWNPPPAGQDVQWLWVGRCLCLRYGVCNQPGLGHLRRAYNQHGLCHRRLVYKKPCLCHRHPAFKQLCLLSGFFSVGRTTGFAFVLGIWCTSSLALVHLQLCLCPRHHRVFMQQYLWPPHLGYQQVLLCPYHYLRGNDSVEPCNTYGRDDGSNGTLA